MRKEVLEQLKDLLEEFKSLEQIKLKTKGTFLKGESYKCFLNNGKTIIREKLIKDGKIGSAAVILPITKEKNVVLSVEPRVFTEKTVGISIPAGYIENLEEPHIGALRELKEESGYVPQELIYLGGFYQDSGCSSAYNRLYLALNCEKKEEPKLDKDEYVKCFEVTYEEALELIELGYIEDCNAIIALEKSKKYRKGRF